MRMLRTLLAAAVLSAAVGLYNPFLAAQTADHSETKDKAPPRVSRDWNPRRTPVVEAVKRVRAAVVNIHSERTVQGPVPEELFGTAPSQSRVNGMGTGIVIESRMEKARQQVSLRLLPEATPIVDARREAV